MTKTGRTFDLERYCQNANPGRRVPDWARVCNGRPTYRDDSIAPLTWVIGLDGVCYTSRPDWEV